MSAIVVVMPVVARPAFDDAAWREQYARECAALCAVTIAPPPRTRPLKVIDNDRVVASVEGPGTAASLALQLAAVRDVLNADDPVAP